MRRSSQLFTPDPVLQNGLEDITGFEEEPVSPVRDRALPPDAPVHHSPSLASPGHQSRSLLTSSPVSYVESSQIGAGTAIDLENNPATSSPSGSILTAPRSSSTLACLHWGGYATKKGLSTCTVKSHPTCLARGGRTFFMLTCKKCGFELCNRCQRAVTDHSGSKYHGKRVGDTGYQGKWTRTSGSK